MRRTLFTLIIALALLLPLSAAHAQDPIRFSAVEIDLWPEYDQPEVLVIYRITLAADTPLPTALSVRIPAHVGEPNAVALKQPDGQLFNTQYDLRSDGEWSVITLTASMLELQIEYYDPNLTRETGQRGFEYNWPGDHAVDALSVQVQQPLGATNTSITPGPVTSAMGADGMTYFTKNIGSLMQDQRFDLKVSYQKETDSLTVVRQPVQSSEPLATTPAWQSSLLSALPWLGFILGVGLIGGGIYWYWRTGQQRQEKPSKRRRRSRPAAQAEQAGGTEIYCHHCGNRAGPGDQFCRACGTRLRAE
jgi:hypothetical protein